MNILDENLPSNQVALLESWRVHVRQIAVNIGRSGMSDEEIIPLLLRHHLPTFFTRDQGFYDRRLCHSEYSVVVLAVEKDEAASFIRRLLRHPAFRTRTKRMGKVIRVSRAKMSVWAVSKQSQIDIGWFQVA
ncbi:MAG: hypothetical protein QOH71_1022 [Blastocatellia bacterium]|nr:hypothetical protein [Blastocatellia bacterium]